MVMKFMAHMLNKFILGCITFLDESIYIWFNWWTWTGYIFVFQNPHPFGNEYHTIACGLTVYFLFGYMVEGMDDNTYLKQSKLVKKGVGGDVFSQ